ncbi:hypothetical protein GCM10010344_01200 [Streptomyces bluensis]|nr:hypothetical protein GCM10010344_01200 [Streptomyces bluensis]
MAAPQQFGGLEAGLHVVTSQVVDQSQIERALQQPAMDLGLLCADQLDLRDRVRSPEFPHRGYHQRDGGRVDCAEADHSADAVLVAGRTTQPVDRVQHGHDVRQRLPALVADLRPGTLSLQQAHVEFALRDGGDVFELLDTHNREAAVHRTPRSRESLSQPREYRLSACGMTTGHS